jgi:hypothetical protein
VADGRVTIKGAANGGLGGGGGMAAAASTASLASLATVSSVASLASMAGSGASFSLTFPFLLLGRGLSVGGLGAKVCAAADAYA